MKPSIAIISSLAIATAAVQAEGQRPQQRQHPNPKEAFERIDTDNSGGVSLAEFQATPRGQKDPERAAKMFERIDADNDGQLTRGELASHRKHRPKPQEMFKKMDRDDSGTISLDEFKATPRGQKDPDKAATLFARIDADSDGQLTHDEMAGHHKKRHDGKGKKHRPGPGGPDDDEPLID